MGLNFIVSNSSYDNNYKSFVSNPDPKNFKILETKIINEYMIIMINYIDCKNYEYEKIIYNRKRW